MHGVTKQLTADHDILKLAANYCFDEQPVHIITVVDDNERVDHYIRGDDSQHVTMLPGVKGGLFTARKAGMRRLSEYNIGHVPPGQLDWVQHMRGRTSALSTLIAYTYSNPHASQSITDAPDPVDDLTRRLALVDIKNTDYKPIYNVLDPDTEYLVTGTSRGTFRGKNYVYARLQTGQAVRCGPSLERIVEEREQRDDCAPIAFKTGGKTRMHGVRDIECFAL